MDEQLRVAVYSPETVSRAGLESILERHPDRFQVVPLPVDRRDDDPDVVLYDVLALLDGDTAPLTHLVEQTASRILAVGRPLRPDLVSRALTLGVDGFCTFAADETELLHAVESAGTGWKEGDEDDDPIVGAVGSAERFTQLDGTHGLTRREQDVLGLVAAGWTNQQIAAKLFLSINSVKTYIRTAYRKIGVASRAQAVSWALQHGLPREAAPPPPVDADTAGR